MFVDKNWLEQAMAIVGQDGILIDASDLEAYSHDEYAMDTYVQAPKAVFETRQRHIGVTAQLSNRGAVGSHRASARLRHEPNVGPCFVFLALTLSVVAHTHLVDALEQCLIGFPVRVRSTRNEGSDKRE